jgi:hypothetical protein
MVEAGVAKTRRLLLPIHSSITKAPSTAKGSTSDTGRW